MHVSVVPWVNGHADYNARRAKQLAQRRATLLHWTRFRSPQWVLQQTLDHSRCWRQCETETVCHCLALEPHRTLLTSSPCRTSRSFVAGGNSRTLLRTLPLILGLSLHTLYPLFSRCWRQLALIGRLSVLSSYLFLSWSCVLHLFRYRVLQTWALLCVLGGMPNRISCFTIASSFEWCPMLITCVPNNSSALPLQLHSVLRVQGGSSHSQHLCRVRSHVIVLNSLNAFTE